MDLHEELEHLRAENERLRRESQSVAIANVRAGLQMADLSSDREAQLQARQAELEEALERAEVAAREKDEFLAKVTHELRTPLNGAIGMMDLLLSSSLTDSQREHAAVAMQSSEELLGLINMILDASAIRARSVQLASSEFDPWDVLQSVARALSSRARLKGVELSLEIDRAMPRTVKGDPDRLRQVLLNLVGNAVKFTDEGAVRVRMRPSVGRDGEVSTTFTVVDSGCGIPEGAEHGLFEDFIQGDNSMARRFGGSGLGLSISKGLIESMGGKINVRSRVEVGSVFRFRIPTPVTGDAPDCLTGRRPFVVITANQLMGSAAKRPSSVADPEAEPDAIKPQAALRGLRILVAEDHPVNQKVTQMHLKRLGAESHLVEDGALAVAAWEAGEFDAILMDCQMPNMDGNEATATIRALEASHPGRPRIPIVALTANTAPADRDRCLASGMDSVVGKPTNLATLAAAVLAEVGQAAVPARRQFRS